MGILDRLTKMAEKAAESVVKTTEKINETYKKEGFDGFLTKTSDSLDKAGKKTQDYFNNIGEKNQKIRESIPEKDLESTFAKAAAVVVNTTQTIVKDAAKVTMDTVESVSKSIEKIVTEQEDVKKSGHDSKEKSQIKKKLFLSDAQIAELDCMPLVLCIKQLGLKPSPDGVANKYLIDGAVLTFNEQGWFDFSNQKGGKGAISFVKHYIRNAYDLGDSSNPELSKEVANSAFDVLTKIAALDEYQKDLSVWIKEQVAKTKKVAEEYQDESEYQDQVKPAKAVKSPASESAVVKAKTVKPVEKKVARKVVAKKTKETPPEPVAKKTRKPKV